MKLRKYGSLEYAGIAGECQNAFMVYMSNPDLFLKKYNEVYELYKNKMGMANPFTNYYRLTLGCKPDIGEECEPCALAELFVQCLIALIDPNIEVYWTQKTKDRGIDVIASDLDGEKFVVDVKIGNGKRNWKMKQENRIYLSNTFGGIKHFTVFCRDKAPNFIEVEEDEIESENELNEYDLIYEAPSGHVMANKRKIKEFGCSLCQFIMVLLSSLNDEEAKAAIQKIREFDKDAFVYASSLNSEN